MIADPCSSLLNLVNISIKVTGMMILCTFGHLTCVIFLQEDVNVIAVDWGAGAGFPYTQAAANVRVVGAEVKHLISKLVVEKGTSPRNFHVIGHSLGSHAAGQAGRLLAGSLGRISGEKMV